MGCDTVAGTISIVDLVTVLVGPSGDLSLLQIDGNTIGPAGTTATLAFTAVDLTDTNGDPLPNQVVTDGVVTIVEPPPAVVSIASGEASPGGTALLDVTVSAITDPDGLCGYNVHFEFTPGIIEVQDVLTGDAPFGVPLTVNIDNVLGFVAIVGTQTGQIPGPVGNTVVARIQVLATGNVGDATPLHWTVLDLSDCAAITMPATGVDGTFTIVQQPAVVSIASGEAPTGGTAVLDVTVSGHHRPRGAGWLRPPSGLHSRHHRSPGLPGWRRTIWLPSGILYR